MNRKLRIFYKIWKDNEKHGLITCSEFEKLVYNSIQRPIRQQKIFINVDTNKIKYAHGKGRAFDY